VRPPRKDETVTDDDLREFAGEIPLGAVSLGRLTGFRTRFSEDDTSGRSGGCAPADGFT
jgi:hypothetical protein